MRIFIEHLEDGLSRWILAEYMHSLLIAGDMILVTGAKIPGIPSTEKRFHELVDPSRVLILDPQADEELAPEDLEKVEAAVVGGILGAHPPLGRTKKLLSDRFPQALKRNIGPDQFPIDGAVYVVVQIARGSRLHQIPRAVGITLRRRLAGVEHEIHLPYACPLVGGRPLISNGILRILGVPEDVEIEIHAVKP